MINLMLKFWLKSCANASQNTPCILLATKWRKKSLQKLVYVSGLQSLSSSNCEIEGASAKMNQKTSKNLDPKKLATSAKRKSSRKQNKKGENPIRTLQVIGPCTENRSANTSICKNSACRAVVSITNPFCKRCSCCICHLFDDNKDPSLWLECTSDSPNGNSCGLSCHIECAFRHGKVGVIDVGQLMHLDGSYCCTFCGKVSGILGCLKKQLSIAKDARRVDNLCYRINLCFRLLDGTSKFKELLQVVIDAKTILENEVGPLSENSPSMVRGIVSRLSIASEIQALCSAAIQKVDEFSAASLNEGLLPAAFKFIFEEVTPTSVVLVLIELSTPSYNDIIGFKLWYSRTSEPTDTKDPVATYPRSQTRILISNLQPCTEYLFRIVSYTETGDFGHSEAKCFTESVEILHKNPLAVIFPHNEGTSGANTVERDTGDKGQDIGKTLSLAFTPGQGFLQDFPVKTPKADELPSDSGGLDLKVEMPDLNEDIAPLYESPRVEDNGFSVVQNADTDHRSGGSENWAIQVHNGEVPAVDSQGEVSRKRPASKKDETPDSVSGLLIGSSYVTCKGGSSSSCLGGNLGDCVKTIRWLECQGFIEQEFRLKLLTWFCLWATEKECRVVKTYIKTLNDDPRSLAEQLVDSFADIVNFKKPRKEFCS